ncbi:hypothetical protein [Paenibacillus hamazuiensis]|uniref:hypothetical protein n=1 Tax=Paenibacillus hamazuiensis TaxID=2936508 RepID=UPI00200F04E8|nr:hypothetical protein [Paenibacillus hamazuiensis]
MSMRKVLKTSVFGLVASALLCVPVSAQYVDSRKQEPLPKIQYELPKEHAITPAIAADLGTVYLSFFGGFDSDFKRIKLPANLDHNVDNIEIICDDSVKKLLHVGYDGFYISVQQLYYQKDTARAKVIITGKNGAKAFLTVFMEKGHPYP